MQAPIRRDVLLLLVCTTVIYGCSVGRRHFESVHQGSVLSSGEGNLREELNPHRGGKCLKCHSVDESNLRELKKGDSGQILSKEERYLRGDLNGLCTACHEEKENDHPVGLVPTINKLDLPLDGAGKINCALTCHDMHGGDEKTSARNKGLLRVPAEELCFSCHDV